MATRPLTDFLPDSGIAGYYSREFMNDVQKNLPALIASATNTIAVDPIDAITFKGNFYSFLRKKLPSIPHIHYWPMLLINGMNDPFEFDESFTSIRTLGDGAKLAQLYSKSVTKVAEPM